MLGFFFSHYPRPEYGLYLVKRTQRDYSLRFKLSLVEQIEKGELTYQ